MIKSCPHELCLYVKHLEDSMTLISLHFDGQLISRGNASELQLVKDEFCKRFQVKDYGDVDEFMGL